jgi:hypothetical protein
VAEGQGGGLIRDPFADQIDPGEQPHRGQLNQSLLHGRLTEAVPQMHQVDAQHDHQWIEKPTTLLAGLGVVGIDQVNERLPGNDRIHVAQEDLLAGALLGYGLLVVAEPELHATHYPGTGLRPRPFSRGSE